MYHQIQLTLSSTMFISLLSSLGECDNRCSQKSFDKNFGRSLLGDYSDHYMSDFVLHGTSDRCYQDKMLKDIRMATQVSCTTCSE